MKYLSESELDADFSCFMLPRARLNYPGHDLSFSV
jgi:hypothetical protein